MLKNTKYKISYLKKLYLIKCCVFYIYKVNKTPQSRKHFRIRLKESLINNKCRYEQSSLISHLFFSLHSHMIFLWKAVNVLSVFSSKRVKFTKNLFFLFCFLWRVDSPKRLKEKSWGAWSQRSHDRIFTSFFQMSYTDTSAFHFLLSSVNFSTSHSYSVVVCYNITRYNLTSLLLLEQLQYRSWLNPCDGDKQEGRRQYVNLK